MPMTDEQRTLAEKNMKLVYYCLEKYYPSYSRDEDLIQCGMIGLCKAAETYDPTKSEFSTYAIRGIRNEITLEFRDRKKHSQNISFEQLFEGSNE